MTKDSKNRPPRWADRFLELFCNPVLLEQIQGDVHELFYWRLDEKGYGRASRSFIWDVIRLFRWSNIRRTKKQGQKLNQIAMFKNYFKIGLRNLWKQRMPSTINVIGLSLAVGCCIVAFKWIEYSYVKDNFHSQKEDIFLVTHWEEQESNRNQYGATDNQLSREILESVPGIKASTRYNARQLEFKRSGKTIHDYTFFVDEHYLDIFDFEPVAGNPNLFNDPGTVVLSESAALQFFGEGEVIGEMLEVKIGEEWKSFQVGAILKNKPNNSSLQINILMNYAVLEQDLRKSRETWNTNFFILRDEGINESTLKASMNDLLPLYNKDKEEGAYSNFDLEPLATMALHSNEMENGVGSAPNPAPNLLLASIATFMLILATFNYINISLAMIMKRLKEIGIRKVIGSRRKQIVLQFLVENFLLCALAILIGLLWAGSLFLPGFNHISGSSFGLELASHTSFWLFLLGLLLFITLVSGIYPAVVASSYKPVAILKKEAKGGGKRWLSSIFMTFQMILAMITIVGSVMAIYTNKVNEARDWGYDQYNKLIIAAPSEEYVQPFRDAIAANPNVKDFAGTRSRVGGQLNGYPFQKDDETVYAELFEVGANYPELLGLELVAGRFFDESLSSDLNKSIVVNETFMESFNMAFDEDGISIMQDSLRYNIIGVVKDYHYWDFGQKIRSAAMVAIPESDQSAFLLEMNPGNIVAQRDEIKEIIGKIAPEYQVGVSIQSQLFDNYFDEMDGIRNILLFTSTLAIILAAMGLYGLVSINISSQIKDFGIRKVLGASGLQLSMSVYKRFRYILGIAILVGGALSVLVVGMLIQNLYSYSPEIGIFPMSVSAFILLGVAFITLNLQVRRVRRMNPAETLRTE
ncbi:ABC transporter permease [Roseivirga sp.]|uniref:ABC transporter permease n=1 Tax=Roseivirga sp. TaxID=1964215 RepID=UPI003B51F5C2